MLLTRTNVLSGISNLIMVLSSLMSKLLPIFESSTALFTPTMVYFQSKQICGLLNHTLDSHARLTLPLIKIDVFNQILYDSLLVALHFERTFVIIIYFIYKGINSMQYDLIFHTRIISDMN
jgi:hypothetical protein